MASQLSNNILTTIQYNKIDKPYYWLTNNDLNAKSNLVKFSYIQLISKQFNTYNYKFIINHNLLNFEIKLKQHHCNESSFLQKLFFEYHNKLILCYYWKKQNLFLSDNHLSQLIFEKWYFKWLHWFKTPQQFPFVNEFTNNNFLFKPKIAICKNYHKHQQINLLKCKISYFKRKKLGFNYYNKYGLNHFIPWNKRLKFWKKSFYIWHDRLILNWFFRWVSVLDLFLLKSSTMISKNLIYYQLGRILLNYYVFLKIYYFQLIQLDFKNTIKIKSYWNKPFIDFYKGSLRISLYYILKLMLFSKLQFNTTLQKNLNKELKYSIKYKNFNQQYYLLNSLTKYQILINNKDWIFQNFYNNIILSFIKHKNYNSIIKFFKCNLNNKILINYINPSIFQYRQIKKLEGLKKHSKQNFNITFQNGNNKGLALKILLNSKQKIWLFQYFKFLL